MLTTKVVYAALHNAVHQLSALSLPRGFQRSSHEERVFHKEPVGHEPNGATVYCLLRGDHREFAVFLAGGPHSNFHVLTQSREKFHDASNGKVARAISHQQRDLRLPHAENFGDLNLCHAAILQDRIDLQGKLGLEQLLLGIGKAQVCKDVSAAFGYVRDALVVFFAFGFFSVLPFPAVPVGFYGPPFNQINLPLVGVAMPSVDFF